MSAVDLQIVRLITAVCVLAGLSRCSICPQEPSCDCRPNTGMFDIYCSDVMNLTPIVKLLHDQFFNSTVNKLMFLKNCRLTTLPDRAFENITMLVFLTSCPFVDIPQYAFHGTRSLSKLDLQNTSFSVIPSGLLNLERLKTFNLKTNKLTALNHELWNLTSLTFITFRDGSLVKLSDDVFIKTPNIVFLDLSYNYLTFLHPNTLKPLNLLERISLRGNQLTSVDGLFKYINPELIDLYDNNLTSLDNAFHRGMWKTKSLNVGKNPIPYLNSSNLKSVFMNLEIFDMSSMKCIEIDPELFSSFPKLKQALMSRNRLRFIPKKLFHNIMGLENIDLSYNNITSIEGIFYNNGKLKTLRLGFNNISHLQHAFQNLSKLETLTMGGNEIQRINNNDFDGLVNLKSLVLSHNKIDTIESGSFTRLQRLQVLELSSNRFSRLNRTVQNMVSLNELSVRSTNLMHVDRDEFFGLTQLSILNLVKNKITSFNGAFQDLRNLKNLNIAKNKLTTLSRSTFPKKIKLEFLWLGAGNKLQCDCRLSWMIKWLAEKNYTVLKDNPLCHLPLRLRGTPVKELTIKDVTVWPEDCPTFCQCECIDRDTEFYVQVNCSDRNLTHMPNILPQELGVLDLSSNKLESINISNYNLIYGLINLNLERNEFTTLPEDILGYVRELKLAGNVINRLPWSTHYDDTLELVTLANNPWICDCNLVDFRKWILSKGDIVADVNETKCGYVGPHPKLYGRVIISLRDTDLCPSVISRYISMTIGLLCALLLGTSMVLAYYRYQLYIKVWLYAHCYTWEKDDKDITKLFDALLSYHLNDEDFAINIIASKLEELRFTLCIPERDILCGGFEAATQMKAVEDSKRVIAVLTEDYMNDAFCMSIFQQAFEQSLEDKVPRIILIKKGDITKSEDMNSELKATLGSTNCIPWGHRLFWERLLYAMPNKRIVRDNMHCDDDAIPILL